MARSRPRLLDGAGSFVAFHPRGGALVLAVLFVTSDA
jgi:hypothetical protein